MLARVSALLASCARFYRSKEPQYMEPKYLRMLAKLPAGGDPEWTVYILRCGDGSLYTGITKNVAARLRQHQRGKGAAYTKTHLPVELVYQEDQLTRSQALIREAKLKQ